MDFGEGLHDQVPDAKQSANERTGCSRSCKVQSSPHHGAPDRNIQKDAVEDTSVVDPKHAARLVRKERLMAVHSKFVEAEF